VNAHEMRCEKCAGAGVVPVRGKLLGCLQAVESLGRATLGPVCERTGQLKPAVIWRLGKLYRQGALKRERAGNTWVYCPVHRGSAPAP